MVGLPILNVWEVRPIINHNKHSDHLSTPKLLRCNCAYITILLGCLTVARVLYHCNLPSGSVLQFESSVISHKSFFVRMIVVMKLVQKSP